jgi:microcystin-dependent protein
MAQSDQTVQNAAFPSVRADINDNLAALFSQSSGNSEPTVKVAFQPWIDTSSNPPAWKIRNAANSGWITIGILDPGGFSAGGTPTGQVIYVAMSSAPSGYLKADGAAVSRSTYAALFAAIGTVFGAGDGSTSFNVPDLRGEFIRSWDDARGVDSGRAFGTAQSDEIKSHTHSYFQSNSGNRLVTGSAPSVNSGTFASTTGATGGAETRPRNVALLACIKF